MKSDLPQTDVTILDLLRKREVMTVSELAEVLGVTATAVRQRLFRLLDQGLIDRRTVKTSRGRPNHEYCLTEQGRRQTGANFADLAIALWKEIRAIDDPEIRSGLVQRLAKRMAEMYEHVVQGEDLAERMESLAEFFRQKKLPFEVSREGQLPVLTAHACPYPGLAEEDPSICALERMMFSEMLGERIKLSACRLDSDRECSFLPVLEASAS